MYAVKIPPYEPTYGTNIIAVYENGKWYFRREEGKNERRAKTT
jgi:hypothetical protein